MQQEENKEEIFEDIDTSVNIFEEYLGLSTKAFFLALVAVILVGIYASILLFGNNSYEVLSRLQIYELSLENRISALKKENAELQHEYFEQKEISAQEEDE